MKLTKTIFYLGLWRSKYGNFYPHIYTNTLIPKSQISIEHIIPKRIFDNHQHANHWKNLAFCDRRTNSLRSDYRIGDPSEIVDGDKKVKIVFDLQNNETGMLVPSERLYIPKMDADMGLISRSIIFMLYTYPYLYGRLDQIVKSNSILEKYYQEPKSEFEIFREIINQS